MHSSAHRERVVRGVQPEVHSFILCRVLREGAESTRMPLSPGLFLDRRWLSNTRSAAACAAACQAGEREWLSGGDWYGVGKCMNSNPPRKRGLTAIDGA